MRPRQSGFKVSVVVAAISVSTLLPAFAVEPSAPIPGPVVQESTSEAQALLETGRAAEALEAADRAVAAARARHDVVGVAESQRARAAALETLGRPTHALAAWSEAQAGWEQVGDGPGRIEALDGQVRLLLAAGQREIAAPLVQQAIAIARVEQDRPRAAAVALGQLAQTLRMDLSCSAGRDVALAVAEVCERTAPESMMLARALALLADLEFCLGNDPLSLAPLRRALSIIERLAPDSLDMARAQTIAAAVLGRVGDFAAAEAAYERAVGLQQRLAPDDVWLKGYLLNILGGNLRGKGDLEGALAAYARALELTDGPTDLLSLRLASISLGNTGVTLADKGDFSTARAYFLRALDRLEALHPGSLHVAQTLEHLGQLSRAVGDCATARDDYWRALAIYERESPDSLWVADTLGVIADCDMALGDFDAAEEHLGRALAIYDSLTDSAPNPYAESLYHGLGEIFRQRGRLAEARAALDRGLAYLDRMPAGGLLEQACLLGAAARVAALQRDDLAAESYLQRAMALLDPPPDRSVETLVRLAAALEARADLASARGQPAEAKRDLVRAVHLIEEAAGPASPTLKFPLEKLALVEAATGQADAALAVALRRDAIDRDELALAADSLTEREALLRAAVRTGALDLPITLASGPLSTDPMAPRAAWDAVIRSRSLVLDSMAERNRAAWSGDDPEAQRLARRAANSRARLASLVARAEPGRHDDASLVEIARARAAKEQAEHELAARSAVFRDRRAREAAGAEEIAAALPSGSALVSFVRFGLLDVSSPRSSPIPSYAAFVIRAGASAPAVVRLGPAEGIDGLVARVYAQLLQESSAPGRSPKRSEAAYREAAAELRRRIWDPPARGMEGANVVYIVPDGQLGLINFAALPAGRSEYMLEAGPLTHVLSTERDLARRDSRNLASGLLAAGDPAFNEASLFARLNVSPRPKSEQSATIASARPVFRGRPSSCGRFRSLRFAPLPAASAEAKRVAEFWAGQSGSAVLLLGSEASEAAVKAESADKRVLHLATHAFFLGGTCSSAVDPRSDAGDEGGLEPLLRENPLLLSGLALAGANLRDAVGPDEEDGVLTAEEIAALDLTGTEWAVLSACDTGLGEIKAGEGLFGLRRAFQVAGARTVISSLWPVEDETARLWMTGLYAHRFKDGLSTAEAVRAASLDVLEDRRSRGLGGHPFHWAAFVAVGDWR
jgi:CHAT domain-containing protein/tetratricopeptide (TPR) repeat protein